MLASLLVRPGASNGIPPRLSPHWKSAPPGAGSAPTRSATLAASLCSSSPPPALLAAGLSMRGQASRPKRCPHARDRCDGYRLPYRSVADAPLFVCPGDCITPSDLDDVAQRIEAEALGGAFDDALEPRRLDVDCNAGRLAACGSAVESAEFCGWGRVQNSGWTPWALGARSWGSAEERPWRRIGASVRHGKGQTIR